MTWLRAVIIILGTMALILLKEAHFSEACNSATCADVVSKCSLNKQCNCKMETCDCCRECSICLNDFYHECCSCFDLCPKPQVTDVHLNRSSQVEEFEKPVPTLFTSLTDEPDLTKQWTSFTYPVDNHVLIFYNSVEPGIDEPKYFVETVDNDVQNPVKHQKIFENCTVVYISECISASKCKTTCSNMGATSYRWFHNGCCECVGHLCINYGLNESRCSKCPIKLEDASINYNDYGQ